MSDGPPPGVKSAMLASMDDAGTSSNPGASSGTPGNMTGSDGMGASFSSGSVGSVLESGGIAVMPLGSMDEGVIAKMSEGGGAFGANPLNAADGSLGFAKLNTEGTLPPIQDATMDVGNLSPGNAMSAGVSGISPSSTSRGG
jgi:hypothetical protein